MNTTITKRMQEAVNLFRSVGSVYAALTIVDEARSLGIAVPSAGTIHQAAAVCEAIGQPKRYAATAYVPDLVGAL